MRVVPSPVKQPMIGEASPSKWWQDWFSSIGDVLQGVWGSFKDSEYKIDGASGSVSSDLVQLGKAYHVSIVWSEAELTGASVVIPSRSSAGSVVPTTLRPGMLMVDVDGTLIGVPVGGTVINLPDQTGDRIALWGTVVPEEKGK